MSEQRSVWILWLEAGDYDEEGSIEGVFATEEAARLARDACEARYDKRHKDYASNPTPPESCWTVEEWRVQTTHVDSLPGWLASPPEEA